MKKTSKEKGFILVTGLIVLLIITIIALYAVANSINGEKVASDIADKQVALQNAETALRVAENNIYNNISNTSAFASDCTGGLCIVNTTTPVWQSITWATDTAHTFTLSGTNAVANTTQQPKYIIELLDTVPAPPGESAKITSGVGTANAYRITAVGWGNKTGTQAMVQSVYVKR
jgi:type IV pilus assembly protein PilX